MPTTEPKSTMARPRRGLRLRQRRLHPPRPPDEGVDTFDQPAETPPPEPDQPESVVLVPSQKPEPVNIGTRTLTATPPRRTPLTRAKRNSIASTACIPSDRTRGWTAAISTRSCGLAANARTANGGSANARRRDEEQRKRDHAQRVLKADKEHWDRTHADGTVHRCRSAGRWDRPLRRVRDSATGARLAAVLPSPGRGGRGLHFVRFDSDDLQDRAQDQDHGPAVRQSLRPGDRGLPGRRVAGAEVHAARVPTQGRCL